MNGRLAFLFSRRWLGFAVLALVVSVTCLFLGRWQLHRYEAKDHNAELVRENYDAAPVALSDLVQQPQDPWPDDQTWRPVQVEGHYLEPALTLPKRPIEGSAADHVLALFVADVGQQDWLLLVDRGWYATDAFVDHGAQHQLPPGEVTLTAHLSAAEPPSDRDLSPGNLHHLNPEQAVTELESVNPDLDLDETRVVTASYGILAEESPSTSSPPAPLPPPSTDLGNHLSYTFQWWVFGIGAWVAFGVMARREAIDRAAARAEQAGGAATGPSDPGHNTGSAPARKRRRFTFADDAAEDALIDAQLAEHLSAAPTQPADAQGLPESAPSPQPAAAQPAEETRHDH